MKPFLMFLIFTINMFNANASFGAEKTITLAVKNMFCASCPYIVKQSLSTVPGVMKVDVSFEQKTATVSFEDTTTNAETLTHATTNAGYPSKVIRGSR